MNDETVEEFDGVSLIVWAEEQKIKSLKEFGCNLNRYDPYEHGETPEFRDEKISWFQEQKSRGNKKLKRDERRL